MALFTTTEEKSLNLGVDIGGTSIYLVLMNKNENVIYEKKVKTSCQIKGIFRIIICFLEEANAEVEQLKFISFGVPGTTNMMDGVVIDAPALEWSNLPLKEKMSKYFNCPIYVENDVNCAAIGEQWKGRAIGCKDFIYISIGTGVGSSIFTNGQLVRGSSFMAGEIGYLLFTSDVENKKYNKTGQFGMLESKLSGTALAENGNDPKQLFKDYYENVAEVKDAVNTFKQLLAISIANIVSLLNPERVVISGGVAQSLEGLIDDINEMVKEYTPIPSKIYLSPLGEASGAIGAVAAGLNRISEKEWSV